MSLVNRQRVLMPVESMAARLGIPTAVGQRILSVTLSYATDTVEIVTEGGPLGGPAGRGCELPIIRFDGADGAEWPGVAEARKRNAV